MDNSHVNFFHFRDGEYPQTEELEESFRALLSNFLPNEHIFCNAANKCEMLSALACISLVANRSPLHNADESIVGSFYEVLPKCGNFYFSHILFLAPYRTNPFRLPFVYASVNNHHAHHRHCVLSTLSACTTCVMRSCVQLCDPMDCSPPGSSVHGIFQARILEWVAVFYSRGSSWPKDRTHVSCISCTGIMLGTFYLLPH